MRLEVVVDRIQYGVGQGGFHCQQVAVHSDAPDIDIEPYRFVYDCGSDTGPVLSSRTKPLEWAVRHYAGRSRVDSAKPKLVVNSLYLSHFQKDHIDGALLLAKWTDVKEIVIPHITREQVAHLFAQQISSGSFGSSGTGAERYLGVLQRAANGDGPIIGNVPTTRVPPSTGDGDDGPPNQQPLPEPEPNSGDDEEEGQERRNVGDTNWAGKPINWKQLEAGQYELASPTSAGLRWNHQSSRLLELRVKSGAAGPSLKNLWELRVWSYAQSLVLSKAIADELKKLESSPGVPALPKLLGGLVDGSEIAWAIGNRIKIQNAYKRALKAHGVKDARDHNVVSLCLHSGPVDPPQGGYQHLSGRSWYPPESYSHFIGSAKSWIGTGDALLSGEDAWNEFKAHFTHGKNRLEDWQTVVVPHHGSGAGGNFNDELFKRNRTNAVISAGAFNKYGHPASDILSRIMDSGAQPILVTEFNRPGFIERIKYECWIPFLDF